MAAVVAVAAVLVLLHSASASPSLLLRAARVHALLNGCCCGVDALIRLHCDGAIILHPKRCLVANGVELGGVLRVHVLRCEIILQQAIVVFVD
jgi:hypothetical protein